MAIAGLVVLSLIFMGALMIIIGYVRTKSECPPPKTVFKFVPRTFVEEQENPAKVSDIFADMFGSGSDLKSTFVTGFRQPEEDKINRAFISQF
jgi:hypothetical protein